MTVSASIGDWRGHEVQGTGGEKLGRLEDVYYDSDSDEPVLLCVRGGMLSHKQVLVPVAGARVTPEQVVVAYTAQDLDGAPTTKPDEELSLDDEETAFRRYGLDYTAPADGRRRLTRH